MNSLPNIKISDRFKSKAFPDDKLNMNQKLNFVLGRVENIVEKEKILVTSSFSFSHNFFQKTAFPGSLQAGIIS